MSQYKVLRASTLDELELVVNKSGGKPYGGVLATIHNGVKLYAQAVLLPDGATPDESFAPPSHAFFFRRSHQTELPPSKAFFFAPPPPPPEIGPDLLNGPQ
jgi:hypothetical protein